MRTGGRDDSRDELGVDRLVVSRYSGIQTPNSQKPHWLKPGSHTGVTVYPQ